MIAVIQPEVYAGYLCGHLSSRLLRELLSGQRNFRSALNAAGNAPGQRFPLREATPGSLVGFLPYPEHPREIIVARVPFTQRMVPAVTLSPSDEDWKAYPQLLYQEQLLGYGCVILQADWLTSLVELAATLKNPRTQHLGVDRTLLAIGTAWERWERMALTWPERCEDLARSTNTNELMPNTLLTKCKRHGLERSDN